MTDFKIFESQDGSQSIYSEQFGVNYHSKYGAVQEARHVFIKAGMFYKALGKKGLTVLEMGFGTGLNALLTCMEAERLGLEIDFTAIEQFPLKIELAEQLNYPDFLDAPADMFQKLHEAEWGISTEISPLFSIHKIHSAIHSVELPQKFDVIYYDAFAPSVQPELWEAPVLEQCYDWLEKNGILVTYCAKGTLKRALRSVGFEVEVLKGPPGKREMIRAHHR